MPTGDGVKVLVAINTFARAGNVDLWHRAVDDAVVCEADALIVADIGVMDYVARTHPQQRLHVSVQAAAANPDAISFYVERFGVKRVVLPRVLTVAEIAAISHEIACETEVFVFGGLCVMAEGRCSLSSYATGKSPNMNGVCSPAGHIHYRQEAASWSRGSAISPSTASASGEAAAYPTLCKGRFQTDEGCGYLFEDPASLDATTMLPELRKAGVTRAQDRGPAARPRLYRRWCAPSATR